MSSRDFDLIIVGGGHAGVEAALVAARMGATAALVTLERAAIGRMSCNPAIGGLAKGQLVREVDALGGEMGLCTDETGIQFRMLNASRGPAVRSPRAQVDRRAYNRAMLRRVSAQRRVRIIEGEVCGLLTRSKGGGHVMRGLRLTASESIFAPAVVLTTGTFLGGVLHSGGAARSGGRFDEAAATLLSRELQRLGLHLGRHKTGTPPRLDRASIDFSRLEQQDGDVDPRPFSFRTKKLELEQSPCYLTRSNEKTHRVVAENAMLSSMFRGQIKGPGPRYCPSIEDKVMRFPERKEHQIFLEPEGRDSPEIYPNGLSTSLPADVQEVFLRTIEGLEEVRMLRPGYAVEYDHLKTEQLRADLSVAGVKGLYAAGQINGTSGYEEAAAQGLIAGINAVLFTRQLEPYLPDRCRSYIAVLVDDLCRVNPTEPYRMFTSRAEHRLYLRHGNADMRLAEDAERLGIVGDEELRRAHERELRIATATRLLYETRHNGKDLASLLRRPGQRLAELLPLCTELETLHLNREDTEEVEAEILYRPYLARHAVERERIRKMSAICLPAEWEYQEMRALKKEAREVLALRRPMTLAEAQRLSGVTPADISVLLVELRRH